MPHTRSSPLALARLFNSSTFPIYALDEDRRIIFCNPACQEWLGISSDELLGVRCQYHSEPGLSGPAAIAVGICPPPGVFNGSREAAAVSFTGADGRLVRRRGEFFPLAEGADGGAGVLAILDHCDSAMEETSLTVEPVPSALHEQLRQFRHEAADRYDLDRLLGNNPAIARVRAQIAVAASNEASVLIVGPRGSGKDHAAKTIHYHSYEATPRALIPLDCPVLTLESWNATLAVFSSKDGSPGSATLLLSDVDELPAEIQPDLSRLLTNRPCGVRVLATATRPLEDLARQDRFKSDLAWQLSTMRIDLPPLAERIDDLPLLAQAFLEAVNARGPKAKQIGGFSHEALDRLAAYGWPRNIDELAQTIEAAHARCQSALVDVGDLPERLRLAADAHLHSRRDETIVLEEFLARVETELIQRALRRAKGNKSKAAKLLGLTRPRLYRRLVQLGLE